MKKRFPRIRTGSRPYISEMGLKMSGPNPKPRRNIDSVNSRWTALLSCRSMAIALMAGDIMVLVKGERSVKQATVSVVVHRLASGQFLGF